VCPGGVVYNIEVDTTHTYLIGNGVVVHNCHHGAAPTYKKIYASFSEVLQVGFTATLSREDGKALGAVWDEVVYSRSVLNMIGNGYLVDVSAKRVDVESLDLGGVKVSRGDYQPNELGDALSGADAFTEISHAYMAHAGRRPGVVFTPTVETARHARDAFQARGIRTEVISAATPREDRLRIFEDFRTGKVQVLANCMVLTEGFDAPWASCAVIARPTRSAALYVQMVGRVLRPWPGKRDALVLDVSGTGGMRLSTLADLGGEDVPDVEPGERLTEAAQRAVASGVVIKDLKFLDHDLFAGSDHQWLSTEKGVLFLSVKSGYVFLWPSRAGGEWDVCLAKRGKKWRRLRTGLSMAMAMAWGEADAEDYSDFSTTTRAKWRKAPPSDGQISAARRMNIRVPEKATRGQLSDLISTKAATRLFDQHVR
jgi:Helicase conserved C-terminal domain